MLAAVGSLVFLFWRGPAQAAGFALGSAASYLSFRWFRHLVDAIGESSPRAPRRASMVLVTLRYFLFGALGYAIVNYFEAGFEGALAGFFVSVAAVILEILYELIYARTS
ncbi:MAG: ATP synthase subunit I [Acidobacteria bacterium]|nr:ATP synthase subunit I [Acidobacteriota bacterium]